MKRVHLSTIVFLVGVGLLYLAWGARLALYVWHDAAWATYAGVFIATMIALLALIAWDARR